MNRKEKIMPSIRRLGLPLVAVSAMLATAPAVSTMAAPVSSSTAVATVAAKHEVKLVRLVCQQTEDSTGADEAYLNYNGHRVWGIVKINDGQARTLGIIRPLSGQATVSLFDEDSPDADDWLGDVVIRAGEVNQGLRFQKFTRDGANYTLYYRVNIAQDDD